MRKLLLILSALAAVLLFSTAALAAEFKTPPNNGTDVAITQNEVPKDLHVVGATVTVNANVSGDLVAVGQNVTVTGNVANSAFLAGSVVTISGNVGHHLRATGDTLIISGAISGDVYAAGRSVTIAQNAVVSGGVYLAGSNVTIDGKVGSASIYSSNLTVNSGAVVNGDLNYRSPQKAIISSGAHIAGATHFTETRTHSSIMAKQTLGIFSVLYWGGTILLLMLLTYIRPITSKELLDRVKTHFPLSLAIGFGTLVLAPIAGFIMVISGVGIPFAILGGLLWLLSVMIGGLFAKLFIGSWIITAVSKSSEQVIDWRAAVTGVVVTLAIGLIPFFGGLANFIIAMAGFGAIVSQKLAIRE